MTAPLNRPWPDNAQHLRIGELCVDLRYRRIRTAGGEVELAQRIFELLLLFLAEPAKLHTRAELFARLWPGLIVEDANLSQSVWLLRKALGEDRKSWIRTVAGAGYISELPAPVEWFVDTPPGVAALLPPTAVTTASPPLAGVAPGVQAPAPLSTPAEPRLPGPAWRSWGAALAVLAIIAAMAIGVDRLSTPPQKVAAQPPMAMTVVLVEVEDRAAGSRWPVKLLHQWLGWKLGSLPEVTLLTEAELAADASATAPKIVFLSARQAADDPEDVLLRARFQEEAGEQRIEVRGALAEVPALVDDLSRQVLTRLAPARAEPWPALVLDATAARRYADAVDAFERRDWIAAAAISGEVVQQSPRFGLAHLQLAQAQASLAQAPAAIASMDTAHALLRPVPAAAQEVMDARRLAANPDPQHQARALAAYARLASRHPGNASLALKLADLQLSNGQFEPALKALASRVWERESIGARIQRLLLLSDAYLKIGDPARALQSAQTAERLTRDAGSGWELQRGLALVQIASIHHSQDPQHPPTAMYQQAAALFAAAGNHTAALYALFRVEATRPPTAGSSAQLDTLLAKAHAGGYRSLEIEILLRSAVQHEAAGDLDNYRNRVVQALAVAETSGDVGRRNALALVVVYEDILRARYGPADARLQRLRGGLQGDAAVIVDRLDAALQSVRGRHASALQTLDRAEHRLAALQPDATAATQAQAELACSRATARLPGGDLAGARADQKRCAASKESASQTNALTALATIELLAGDRVEARAQLQLALATVAKLPGRGSRWIIAMELAGLLTRIGDLAASDRLYAQLLPELERSGYVWLIAQAETGLAENAAARGDWPRSRQHLAAARKQLPADEWALNHRLDLIDAAAAWHGGERERAIAIATRVHDRARRLGDVVVQIELHSLLPAGTFPEGGGMAERERLIARTGMRGATSNWLNTSSVQDDARATDRQR